MVTSLILHLEIIIFKDLTPTHATLETLSPLGMVIEAPNVAAVSTKPTNRSISMEVKAVAMVKMFTTFKPKNVASMEMSGIWLLLVIEVLYEVKN